MLSSDSGIQKLHPSDIAARSEMPRLDAITVSMSPSSEVLSCPMRIGITRRSCWNISFFRTPLYELL